MADTKSAMPTPVLICDDSSFAQKQMARALPQDWAVELSFAKNGREGLELILQGRGDIVLLDLNMPEVDGYQVLQEIKLRQLNSVVIVVSGDVQPEALKRVLELGAADFIKKPIERDELTSVLDKFGLRKHSSPASNPVVDVSVELNDGYQEIANVAMGRASDLLARLLDCFVVMPIPKVNLIEINDLRMLLQSLAETEQVSAVCQGFIGGGVAGEAMLMFNENSFSDLAELMRYEGNIDEVAQLELLMDIASILIGACLKGISDQLDIQFSQGHPVVLGQHVKISDMLKRGVGRWRKTLSIQLQFSVENRNIRGELILLFTEDTMPRMAELVSYVLE